MKIVLLDADTIGEVRALARLRALGDLKIYRFTSREDTISRAKDANVIISNKVVIDREVIDACPHLQLICVAATGMNNIDLEYAASQHIPVRNVKGYSTDSVAQQTFAMLFYLMNHIRFYDEHVKQGHYQNLKIFTNIDQTIHELAGKTYGIIGMGEIGKKVATIAAVFGANVIYYSTSGHTQVEGYSRRSLEELLALSDVVSIHCPLYDKTKNLIGMPELTKMKSTAILINVARGGIVVESALADALRQHVIAGAGVDVYSQEPILADNPLLAPDIAHRLVLSPHTAWSSLESRERLVEGIIQNIKLGF